MRALCAAVLLACSGAAWGWGGTVTRVSDGDTLWVRPLDGGGPVKLRVQGIDAPELCQPWGKQARDALSSRVLRRRVEVEPKARDDYGRLVARVHADGEDMGAWMVRQGHAWSERYRAHMPPYQDEEAAAHEAQRGLFAQSDALPPRVFRKLHGPCLRRPY